MKKIILTFAAILVTLFGINAYAADKIEIYIDGELLECEAEPVNINERVLVPVRAIFEALDSEVSWDGVGRTVWSLKDGAFICLPVDNEIMSTGIYNSNGEGVWVDQIYLDTPAQIINDYTYVPIRAVAEALSTNVSWDGENDRVVIDSRSDVDGSIYYASDSDYQRLYAVGKNGDDRKKISDKSVHSLEMYGDYVYYLSKDENFLYKANAESGVECLINKAVNKLAVSDGWIYYQETDGKKSGVLYRMNTESKEVSKLTDTSVQYPQMYKDYIYFNIPNDNNMYGITLDGTAHVTINMGDENVKFYPFNGTFFGDYIITENGAWYGNLMRVNLDGSDLRTLTQTNSILLKNQTVGDKILFLNPNDGQDIYCINIDGTDMHHVVSGESSWIDIKIIAQSGDTIYYKNPMRGEMYRVNLDGSDNAYVGFANDAKIYEGQLFTSYKGLYIGSLDGSDLTSIYDREVKDFEVKNDNVYLVDKKSGRLFLVDFAGNKAAITNDSIGEWVSKE